jgi:hypothetical protein
MNRPMLAIAFVLIGIIAAAPQFDSAAADVTLFAVADAHVRADTPSTNYNGTSVDADNSPVTYGYFKFDATGQAGFPTKAVLYLTVGGGSSPETPNGPDFRLAGSGWTETGVTYGNRPPDLSAPRCDYGAIAAGQVISCDVTTLYAGGVMTFKIAHQTSGSNTGDGSRFFSRTQANPPRLVLTFADSPTPTPTPLVATATPTTVSSATPTNTSVPTNTPTPLPATSTPTSTATHTPTLVPPTSTPIPPTSTVALPTSTFTPSSTPIPPTPTRTPTPIPPTATFTPTSVPPTITATSSPVPPSNTPPPTVVPTPPQCLFTVAPGQSIQATLNQATAGCTVRLLAGTHTITSELTMANNGVTLDGDPGSVLVGNIADPFGDLIVVSANQSIISDITGQSANQAIINQNAGSVGLQVTGGDFSDAATGVQIQGQSASISGNHFHDLDREINGSNCSLAHGGQAIGVLNTSGPVTIENNTASNNVVPSACFGTDGAFVEIFNSSNVMVMDNEDSNGVTFIESAGATSGNQIHGNTVTGTDSFLTLHNPANFDIQNNIVSGQSANTYMGGGSPLAFKGNQIAGSGRQFWLDTKPPVCTWSGNTYTWVTGGTFGHAGGTNYSSVSAWVSAVESCPQPTSTPLPTSTPTVGPSPTPTNTSVPGQSVEVIAAGDIACDTAPVTSGSFCHYGLTSDLVVNENPDAVLMLGDAQYETGTQSLITARYHPTWGRFLNVTYATAGGSHDFYGGGYWYTYFSPRAGAVANQNWFATDLGNGWRLISLNSYCDQNGNCQDTTPDSVIDSQTEFLAAELAAHPNECSIVMWHEPRYTSFKRHQNETRMDVFWDMAVNGGVDIALWGHLHNYERFAPIGTSDNADPNGMTAFIVGTGGRSLETTVPVVEPHSVVRNNTTYGVLKLTLYADHAEFVFLPEPGKTFTDSGTIPCH